MPKSEREGPNGSVHKGYRGHGPYRWKEEPPGPGVLPLCRFELFENGPQEDESGEPLGPMDPCIRRQKVLRWVKVLE